MVLHNVFPGDVFNRLTVLSKEVASGKTKILCRCICGKEILTRPRSLFNGDTKSCGCFRRDRIGAFRRTHGLSKSPEYATWCNMRRRCSDKNNISYANYGGKGITVCDRWLVFSAFIEDMGRKPFPKATIERIDNYKGYYPDNCRWATQAEQTRNYSRNKRIVYQGKTRILKEWCELLGLDYDLTQDRLSAHGWSVEEAFTTKDRLRPTLLEFRGEKKTLRQWCLLLGLRYDSILYRIRKGWSVVDAFSMPIGSCGNNHKIKH